MGKMVISRSEAKFQANKKESDNSCWLIFSRLVEREVCSAQGASLALEGRTGIETWKTLMWAGEGNRGTDDSHSIVLETKSCSLKCIKCLHASCHHFIPHHSYSSFFPFFGRIDLHIGISASTLGLDFFLSVPSASSSSFVYIVTSLSSSLSTSGVTCPSSLAFSFPSITGSATPWFLILLTRLLISFSLPFIALQPPQRHLPTSSNLFTPRGAWPFTSLQLLQINANRLPGRFSSPPNKTSMNLSYQ